MAKATKKITVKAAAIPDAPQPEQPKSPHDLIGEKIARVVLGERPEIHSIFLATYRERNGEMDAVVKAPGKLKPFAAKLKLAGEVAALTAGFEPVMKVFQEDRKILSMRDIALNFDKAQLKSAILSSKDEPTTEGETPEEKADAFIEKLHKDLFHQETSAVLRNMLGDATIWPTIEDRHRKGVLKLLGNKPDFSIRTESVHTLLQDPELFKGMDEKTRDGVATSLKHLQLSQAISPTPAAVPVLMRINKVSAFSVTELPETNFVNTYGSEFGEAATGRKVASEVYYNATNNRIRTEHHLMAILEAVRGTGIAAIDKAMSSDGSKDTALTGKREAGSLGEAVSREAEAADENPLQKNPVSWEALFGSADFCECGECTSVYSPAAYFVELMQYLRNNNLDPNASIRTDPKDISNTPLEKILRRRPDLFCLELTCENTNTVLPYIDLVNEVLENFVVHLKAYAAQKYPKQVTVEDVFNVEDETTAELLAQPQHTDYEAYCILSQSVYPFTLPYHQPIDAARIFLEHLGTKRLELLREFRVSNSWAANFEYLSPHPAGTEPKDDVQKELKRLIKKANQNALAAESLGLTEDEYLILTKHPFLLEKKPDYLANAQLKPLRFALKQAPKPVHEYYGYQDPGAMADAAEGGAMTGLTFVKKQFLMRTGIAYADLAELLKTRYINPRMPQGKWLRILESVRFSYAYLKKYADENGLDKLADMLAAFENPDDLTTNVGGMMTHIEPEHNAKHKLRCPKKKTDEPAIEKEDIRLWVKCWFERLGKLIVLEGGDGMRLSVEGNIHFRRLPATAPGNGQFIGKLSQAGSILKDGELIGTVNSDGEVKKLDGTLFPSNPTGGAFLELREEDGTPIAVIYPDGKLILNQTGKVAQWQTTDTCDLEKIHLKYLDGTDLDGKEGMADYDRMQRFIRLWRKLGWTMDEVDKAITGLGAEEIPITSTAPSGTPEPAGDDCADCGDDDPDKRGCADCIEKEKYSYDISPKLIRQLAAVKKLLDQTGLELIKLLSFWADISTAGEKSLYRRLFLNHNLLGIDKVFKADDNGNFLSETKPVKVTDHLPVLMAAINLTAEDIEAIMGYQDEKGVKIIAADELTLKNVSTLYRFRLLAKTIGVKIPELLDIVPLFGVPFADAQGTLKFLEKWGKMEDAGFTFRQLNYIIRDFDDPKKTLGPTKKAILQLTKTLFDGLNAIDEAHKNLAAKPETTDPADQDYEIEAQATSDFVRSKAALIFDPSVVDSILGILEGTSAVSTNAPTNLIITIADDKSLKTKLKYDKTEGTVQITGILTTGETTDYKALSNDAEWGKALTRLEKHQAKMFKQYLSAVFEAERADPDMTAKTVDDAEVLIKSGDVSHQIDTTKEPFVDDNTAAPKRVAFLTVFMPYLRKALTRRFIADTLGGLTGLDRKTTETLISAVLTTGAKPEFLYSTFEKIKNSPQPAATEWMGYLIPAADDAYTFIVKKSTAAPQLTIDGEALKFTAQEDPTNEWWSDTPKKLEAGKLRQLKFQFPTNGGDLKNLSWKTETSAITPIPTSVLLPDIAHENLEPAFVALKKAAILVAGFNLSVDEIYYFDEHKSDFDGLDFNHFTLAHWLRLDAYTRLRNSLPETKTNMLDFWKWTALQPAPAMPPLPDKIAELTQWKKETVAKMLIAPHFNLQNADFNNEKALLKLQRALRVAEKIGMDADRLFEWAKPASKYWDAHDIAESIRMAVRAKYTLTDWEQAVKPLNDTLRDHQRTALVDYLLVQKPLIEWGVKDADGLFEFFLIDVQMDSCMETSRIKQALSSVQLFVHRCFLGLEEPYGVKPNALDRPRWEWMQRYRVWEANRKVFLYPENWIESNLRDDKSPFFKELEGELLQKDINKQNVVDALKSYLYKVDEVANMEVVGLYIEEGNYDGKPVKKLHVFSRTRHAPYFFYYRYFDIGEGNWYPWEKMQVDIPSYDEENATGQLVRNGCYLTPFVWNGRLLVFFPQFMKKTKANENTGGKAFGDMVSDSPNASKPTEYWEIKLAWSEYRNGKWTQKQLSKDAIYHVPDPVPPIAGATFASVAKAVRDTGAAAKSADDSADLAKSSATNTNTKARASNNVAKAATDSVPIDILLPFGQIGVINTVNDIHKATSSAQSAAEDTKNKAVDTKTATATSLEKAIIAVSAVEDFETASGAKGPNALFSISNYEFVPTDNGQLQISVFYDKKSVGLFEFNGTHLGVASPKFPDKTGDGPNHFHYLDSTIKSLQSPSASPTLDYEFYHNSPTTYTFGAFHYPHTHDLLGLINTGKLEDFFPYNLQIGDKNVAFGKYNFLYHELKCPYSLYSWELFFHTPMMLADALSKAQYFEEAMRWFHFVFNPFFSDPAEADTTEKRFWRYRPFKETNAHNTLERIFNNLQPNNPDEQINNWRNRPFLPHLVARDRPASYMKWVVTKYLDNLIAWGDSLFRQDTIETINEATQLYIIAGHILGPKPQLIPRRSKKKPETYLSLLDRWDAFGNAMTELELAMPYSNQTTLPAGKVNNDVALANVFGFATSLYFCIPNNPKLLGYWDTIADRLFKIRHCENIEGVFRKLPLFEPPIDPALLVNAAAQGLSIASVLNDLNTPMPNYRFYYLLQKALELCGELKSLGGAMLSAIEKKDNETIALMRAKHESTMHNLMMEVKKQQLEEAQKSLESLQQNRKGPEARMKYYLQLVGEDVGKVPGLDSDFSELANAIETPVDESGLKLIKYEKEDMDKAHEAADWQVAIGVTETLAGIFNIIPQLGGFVTPIGVGATVTWGGSNLGSAASAVARGMQTHANQITYHSTTAGKKGSFTRAIQDRIMQANAAGYEIKQIDKQITAQKIRIAIANLEITNQQKQIDNAAEVEEFLKNKYTNEELYTWMRGSLKTLYHQVYSLAFDLAKKAEKVFRFERGLTISNFIQAGYWNEGYDGLLSGEQLYVGLKQLEAAHQENRGYDYEITKHISLRQINPLAVLQLKEAGKCEFELPEVLFDMDFPGHYKRRIKSVSLSIPCVAGPYTNINATLRLTGNKFRNTAIAKDKTDYLEKAEASDERFSRFIIPISAIAASSAQNDSGMFELNFKDERYLPFEGAGVISKWRLELPDFRQFDYDTISDAVIHVRYTATEGGERLKKAANDTVLDFIKANEELGQQEGLFAIIDLKHDLPSQWHKAMLGNTTDRSLVIPAIQDFLPYFSKLDKDGKPRTTDKISATDIVILTFPDLLEAEVSLIQGNDTFGPFGPGMLIGEAKTLVLHQEIKAEDWELVIKNTTKTIDRALMVVRFVLT